MTPSITVPEDDPMFNAGKGAVFTHDAKNEPDASMDGSALTAGAVETFATEIPPLLGIIR